MEQNAPDEAGNFFATLRTGFAPALDAPCLTVPCLTGPKGKVWTYRNVDTLSAKMAGALCAMGLQPGDRICVQVEKSPANVALYLGALRAGIVYVPLNTAYTTGEVSYFLDDADPQIFVCDGARATDYEASGVQRLTLNADGGGGITDAAEEAAPFPDVAARHSDDLAVILYTSGTTGRAKGAMLSHGNLASNALALHRLWGIERSDVLLHALPIFHIHGLFVALHTAMLNGSEILFLPTFGVEEVRNAMARATIMMGVPTFYTRLLSDPAFNEDDCKNIRLFISGSAPLTAETFDAFHQRTGCKILERYGMSEAGMIASNPLDGERVAGTVGYALPGVEIRITGDNGEALGANEAGNIEVKGPNIFKGYWRQPEKTASEFRDGWFVTGDIGALDETGRLTLSGRAKDLIIAGGYNIYPKEIEEVLDAIEGVQESAVIGAPHPDMGEGVVAVLVSSSANGTPLTDRELKEEIAGLARFKQPRRFFWIDALPRNAMGKVQKQILREQYTDVFTIEECDSSGTAVQ